MKNIVGIVCDASSLISLTDACFLDILYMLKKEMNFNFLIPESVKYECVDRPLGIKKYSMSAIRILSALNNGILEEIKMNVDEEIGNILHITNNLFYAKGKSIHLVDRGEAGMIAISNVLDVKNLLMDERTTRMLIESPSVLKNHLEKELNVHITVNELNLNRFRNMTKGINVFRSTELLLLAFEKGWFNKFEGVELDALRAALYKTKFAGCSTSFTEIEEAVSMYRKRNRW